MKTYLVTLVILVFSFSVTAADFNSTIYSIEASIVKFDNGRVGFVSQKNREMLKELKNSQNNQDHIEVNVNNKNYIIAFQKISSEDDNQNTKTEQLSFTNYKPTVLKTTEAATKIFKQMKRSTRGECFDKAHIWSFEAFKKNNLNSMKLFLFFTNRYIRKYNYKWWFHVTPMTYVGKNMRTLDRRYTTSPRMTKSWTDIFIKSKQSCPVVKLYDDYESNQEKRDCYLLPVSMYYFSPKDIKERDETGTEKERFIGKEVRKAYREAFKIDYDEYDEDVINERSHM